MDKPKVTGLVSFDVKVVCPHCERRLHLNQPPYDEDESPFESVAEGSLADFVLGWEKCRGRWEGFSLEYECVGCKKTFILTDLRM